MFWNKYFDSIGVNVFFWSALCGAEEVEEWPILNRDELLRKLRGMSSEETCSVGMIGYPNVGKSSTINALLNNKKTAVSATPGRTKHLQTHLITHEDNKLMLCDCPGLVMPNFVIDQSELVLSSILPLSQMIDYMSPAILVHFECIIQIVQRIPICVLKQFYNVTFTENSPPPSQYKLTEDFLGTLAGGDWQ
ncbi:GTPase LSG1-1-like [Octopus sinensis]|uniref:Large subunit GTPase 1 homolog n=1 Tax=Octopus sinensis TaxID=2607531 RepID=A0A6P7TW99_9MOLL|nr:GTPase LSG1-1-like [Octopus sinensis]